MKKTEFLINKPKSVRSRLILAHGAGAPMDSEWMNELSENLKNSFVEVIRFEFPYMQERRKTGKKRPPNSQKQLLEYWKEVIEYWDDGTPLCIGGKSMGGRMASLIADSEEVHRLIVFGFPFAAPGKPMGDRVEHLKKLKTPSLILQGTRDTMGSKEMLKGKKWSRHLKITWFEDGDHSLNPRKSSGADLKEYLKKAAQVGSGFLSS